MQKQDTKPEVWPPRLSLGEIYYVLFRHKGKVLGLTALGILTVVLIYQLTPPVYRSNAKLLVRYVKESTVPDSGTDTERVRSPDERGLNIINSEIEILMSPELAERAIEQIGIGRFQEMRLPGASSQEIARSILKELEIEAPRRSNIIRLSYDGPAPGLAQETLQAIIANYLQKHIEVHSPPATHEILMRKTTEMAARLAQTEEELRRVKHEAGVLSLDQAKVLLSERIEELKRALQQTEVSLSSSLAQLEVLRTFQGRAVIPPAEAGDEEPVAVSGDTYTTLSALRAREQALLATYTPDSIPVSNIRRRIEEFEQRLATAHMLASGTNLLAATGGESAPYIMQLTRVSATKARIDALKRQLEQARGEAAILEQTEGRILELQRRQKMEEQSYLYFSQNLEKARLDNTLFTGRISNISVVQPATYPTSKSRPDIYRNIVLCIVLFLAAGVGLAFAMENADHSLKRPAEVEAQLNMPVLVSVPVLAATGRTRAGAEEFLCTATGDPSSQQKWPLHPGMEPYAEALHNDVVKALDPRTGGAVVVGITGCLPDSGVSSIACAWSVLLARIQGSKVLLVNGATLQALESTIGSTKPAPGALDKPADGPDRSPAGVTNLSLLDAPQDAVPGSGVLKDPQALVAALREQDCDFVLVDLPPVARTGITIGLAPALDSVVLVIRAEKVRREQALKAQELLARAGSRASGVAFNKRRFYVPAWLYRMY